MLISTEKAHQRKRIAEAVAVLNNSEVGRLKLNCIAQLINVHSLRDSKRADEPSIYILLHYGFGKDTYTDVVQAIGEGHSFDILQGDDPENSSEFRAKVT